MNELNAVLEYNDKGVTLWSLTYPGAFARGETAPEAAKKLSAACRRYRLWAKLPPEAAVRDDGIRYVRKYKVDAAVEDGFTSVLFPEEKLPMDMARYTTLKTLCLRSARDLETLFSSIPQKDRALVKSRRTLYGKIPATARETLRRVEAAQRAYAAVFGVELGDGQGLLRDRNRLFNGLEAQAGYLADRVVTGPDGEQWTMQKLLRRLLWLDALHGRALYRRAVTFWQKERIKNPFGFTK